MRDLTVRLSALDPEAGAALRVVAYFDELAAGHAGLRAVLRGAAVLTGSPAALVDARRRLRVRVDTDGVAGDPCPEDPSWLRARVDEGAELWLERVGPARVVDAVVLERAAALLRDVLDRTRPVAGARSSRGTEDAALVEVLLDASAALPARERAARALGLDPRAPVRALARAGRDPRVVPAAAVVDGAERTGVGPAVAVDDLPASWSAARSALRLTAEGVPADPGPRVVHAEQVQALLLLADAVGPGTPPAPDVLALERAAAGAPWMLTTLAALVSATSRRAAAHDLAVHHSTLAERLAGAERALGWDLHEPAGLLRLHLALVLRRLHRNVLLRP